MKKTSHLTLISLLVVNCSAFAVSPAEGWYIGLTGGVSAINNFHLSPLSTIELQRINLALLSEFQKLLLLESLSNSLALGVNPPILQQLAPIGGSVRHSVGGDFGGQVGYRWCNFRFEGELLFNYAPDSEVTIGGIGIKKRARQNQFLSFSGNSLLGAGLFNTYYDFYDEDDDPTWIPYLGLGVGYGTVRNKTNLTVGLPPLPPCVTPFQLTNLCVPQTTTTFTLNNNRSGLVAQGIIGISYYTSDNLAIGIDYRYLTSATAGKRNGGGSRLSLNALNLTLNYWFTDD